MAQKGIRPNGETYQLIIQFFTAGKNVELALQFLHEMKLAGFEPSLQTVRDIVIVVAEQGYSRLAVDLATEFEANSIRRLGPEPWLSCLIASAEDVWVSKMMLPRASLVLMVNRTKGYCGVGTLSSNDLILTQMKASVLQCSQQQLDTVCPTWRQKSWVL